MSFNQLSDNISAWFQQNLTPDKLQPVKDFINNTIDKLYNASWMGINQEEIHRQITQFFTDSINSPMPAVWQDTTGKALEQFIKAFGG
jgi:hypothetical protein